MILADVMDEIAARLRTIKGLRVHEYPALSVTPPAAVVLYPQTYTFDETYGRGSDRMTLPIAVMIGRASERSTRDLLSVYLDGSGPKSIKAAIETGLHAAFDDIRVTGVESDVQTMAGTDYWVSVFQIDIFGSGS